MSAVVSPAPRNARADLSAVSATVRSVQPRHGSPARARVEATERTRAIPAPDCRGSIGRELGNAGGERVLRHASIPIAYQRIEPTAA